MTLLSKKITYYKSNEVKCDLKLKEMLEDFPDVCKTYFRGINPKTTSKTRLAYANDLKVFFAFLINSNPSIKSIKEISTENLSMLTSLDIEEYMEYLRVYTYEGKQYINSDAGVRRKMFSLRSLFSYLYENKMISANPTVQVCIPKIKTKEIIRLEPNETAILLDSVEYNRKITDKKHVYQEKNMLRNLAIITTMLGTGIRVSECVGLNIDDIDLDNDCLKVTRKGGSEDKVYFGDEVRDALVDYIEVRKGIVAIKEHEDALFLSSRKIRISVRSVEALVKEYSRSCIAIKNITPHKLRSTYGTALYQETGDIYMVADVLGHKDVNTTRKHYAAISDERKRNAKDKVRLRRD